MTDTIEVLNVKPEKTPTRVDRGRYAAMKRALLRVIPRRKEGVPFRELSTLVRAELPGGELPGGGSIGWHVTTVKLDLEARGSIERVPGASPQRVRRARA